MGEIVDFFVNGNNLNNIRNIYIGFLELYIDIIGKLWKIIYGF